jgi:hypothetical protein
MKYTAVLSLLLAVEALELPTGGKSAAFLTKDTPQHSLASGKFTTGDWAWKEQESHRAAPVPPVSTTMKCVINLTIQYFIVYTALAVVRTYNELNNTAPLTFAPKILQAACTTVNYAPMLSVLFLGTRMRAIQLSGGDPDGHDLPQPWVKMAMQACAWAVLVQTLMVVAVPLVMGGEPKVSEDGTPEVDGSSTMGKVFTAIKYAAMLAMYGGFTTVCVGAFMMEAPTSVYPDGAPPVSPAVACTMNLTTQYFAVYLLVAIMRTYHDFYPKTPMSEKLEGTMVMCQNTVGFAPMLCILFIGARMRALQIDPVNGNPQKWAQACFYLCAYAVLVQVVILMMIPLVLDGKLKPGSTEGDVTFELPNPTMMTILTAARYMVMLALYGGFTAVIVSVCDIEGKGGAAPPPVSPAMQCVMNLTVQFFFVYLMLWVCVTTKQFTSSLNGVMDIAIPTLDSAKATVQFCPMLSVLFVGLRMRALQITQQQGQPQGWAQEAMFLCTYAVMIQVFMVLLLPLFTRSAPVMDADGNVKPQGTGIMAWVLVALRYFCFAALYGGVVTVIYALFVITVETADGSGKVFGIDPPPSVTG